MTPFLAVSTSTPPASESCTTESNLWILNYQACPTDDAARAWADKTVLWRDEVHSIPEWEEQLQNAYWKPGEGRFSVELHIAAVQPNAYLVMGSMAHWVTDGRGLLVSFDAFFKNLRDETGGNPGNRMQLRWGEEVKRLGSATIRCIDIHRDDRGGIIPGHLSSLDPDLTLQLPPMKPFFYALHEQPNWEGLPTRYATIQLSSLDTVTFYAACKRHKATTTAVIISLHILADIEIALRVAPDDESFQEIYDDLKISDIYLVGNNLADRRSFLVKGPTNAMESGVYSHLAIEFFPTFHDLRFIRQCIKVQYGPTIKVDLGLPNFWNGVVQDAGHQLKVNAESSPETFANNERRLDEIVTPSLDFNAYFAPGIGCTSIGRISSLGVLNEFMPSKACSTSTSPFVIDQIALSLRVNSPDVGPKAILVWDYDEKLHIRLTGSPRWHSADTWKILEESVRRLINQVLDGERAASGHETSKL